MVEYFAGLGEASATSTSPDLIAFRLSITWLA